MAKAKQVKHRKTTVKIKARPRKRCPHCHKPI